MRAIDLTNAVFGSLTVVSRAAKMRNRTAWLCKCVCGKMHVTNTENLRSGHAGSCGCLQSKRRAGGNPKHRGRKTRLYSTWCSMKTRCTNPRDASYPNYGGRGIKVCDAWMASFEAFRRDMGEPPAKTTLDRIDVNAGYSPENCRWVPRSRQGRNTRRNRMESYQGQTMCLADWSERLRIPYGVLIHRLHRGATFEEAVKVGWESDVTDERRIKAALAAVEGISTEALEAGVLAEMLAALEAVRAFESHGETHEGLSVSEMVESPLRKVRAARAG